MRVSNSPEYEEAMRKRMAEKEKEHAKAERKWKKLLVSGLGSDWSPMSTCPFQLLSDRYGSDAVILTSDGENSAVSKIRKRFGRPVFYKKEPEMVFVDGFIHWVHGEIDPREDLPSWFWEWEITDELAPEQYSRGEPAGQPEISFTPTAWRFMPVWDGKFSKE